MAKKQFLDKDGLNELVNHIPVLVAGDNVTLTPDVNKSNKITISSTGGSGGGNIQKIKVNGTEQTIDNTDKSVDISVPTYESKEASNGGTDVSLVTTGEKAIWNAGSSSAGTITGITMNEVSKGTSGVVDLGTVITDVSDRAVNKTLTDEDLDTIKTPGFYNAGGSNTCANQPSTTPYAFGMTVEHTSATNWYVQTLTYISSSNKPKVWKRVCASGTWQDWYLTTYDTVTGNVIDNYKWGTTNTMGNLGSILDTTATCSAIAYCYGPVVDITYYFKIKAFSDGLVANTWYYLFRDLPGSVTNNAGYQAFSCFNKSFDYNLRVDTNGDLSIGFSKSISAATQIHGHFVYMMKE